MTPVLLAIGCTVLFSSTFVFARRGLLYCHVLTGTLIATGVNFALLTLWVVFTAPLSAFFDRRILLFFALGILVPSISRLVLLAAVEKVGASRSASLRAMSPFLAMVLAVFFLGERPTPLNVFGMAAIIVGGVLLSMRGRLESPWRRRDMLYPLVGTLLLAMRDVVIRFGVSTYPHPGVGAWATVATSVVALGGFWLWRRPRGEGIPPLGGWVYFGLVGTALGIGFVMLFFAFQLGQVIIISPISGTTPLFTLIFSALFLRDLEPLTLPLVVGVLCIVFGGVMVALQQ